MDGRILDEHTRGGILRGGSYYQPQGSIWYFPQAYRNDQHGKLLLMAPGYDRSGALGSAVLWMRSNSRNAIRAIQQPVKRKPLLRRGE